MNKGLWVWPSDPKGQRAVIGELAESHLLVRALTAIAKSKEGLSNAEVDDLTSDSSNWMTLWVVRQLISLGFIEYKVDYFGGPGRYTLTETGRSALPAVTGQPQPKASVPAPPVPPTTPKTA